MKDRIIDSSQDIKYEIRIRLAMLVEWATNKKIYKGFEAHYFLSKNHDKEGSSCSSRCPPRNHTRERKRAERWRGRRRLAKWSTTVATPHRRLAATPSVTHWNQKKRDGDTRAWERRTPGFAPPPQRTPSSLVGRDSDDHHSKLKSTQPTAELGLKGG